MDYIHSRLVFRLCQLALFHTLANGHDTSHFIGNEIIKYKWSFHLDNVNLLSRRYRIENSCKTALNHFVLIELVKHTEVHGVNFHNACETEIFKGNDTVRYDSSVGYYALNIVWYILVPSCFLVGLSAHNMFEKVSNHKVKPISVDCDIKRYKECQDTACDQSLKCEVAR